MGWFTRKRHDGGVPPPKCDHLGYPLNQQQKPPQPPQATARPPLCETQTTADAFQPAGYLPAPPSWNPVPSSPPPPYQDSRPYGPVIVNQHYYLNGPVSRVDQGTSAISRLKLGSVLNLATDIRQAACDDGLPQWHTQASQMLNQGAALYDQIHNKFNTVMTMIDCDKLSGNETDLFQYQSTPEPQPTSRALVPKGKGQPKKTNKKDAPKGQTTAVASTLISGSYFAKVDLYANSRLPLELPPLRLYIPTWPLICLAAQYAERVYQAPRGAERNAHVDADWRTGTKAMYIKSVPMDHMNTIVFAIRGTATFMDWAVNLNTAPTAPTGFLDDASNFCHAGFLSAARKMIKPVAARLRQLLEENPNRSCYSLLITGHSAGGAVASLLYSHMLSKSSAVTSELTHLTGCFKRVHCVTFGSPPTSLVPLQKPKRLELRKSLFLSFVNEGDPVARADKAYVKSLLELFATPAPSSSQPRKSSDQRLIQPSGPEVKQSKPKEKRSKSSLASKASKTPVKSSQTQSSKSSRSKPPAPVWQVPSSTLSSPGRIVVLRSGDPKARPRGKKTVEERLNEGVVAQITTDEQLRGVIWGDPVCHVMRLYAGRIETLAVGAVTGKGH